MSRRLSALLIWSLVAAATVYWSLRLFVQPAPLPPSARLAGAAPTAAADWGRLLGVPRKAAESAAVQPALAARFRLTGVAAAGASAGVASAATGVALIAIDGKPARAYRVGQRLEGEYVLQSVSLRSATLGTPVAGSLVLEIPPAAPAATALLPMPAAPQPPATPPPPQPSTPQPVPSALLSPIGPPAAAPAVESPPPPQTPDLRSSPLAR